MKKITFTGSFGEYFGYSILFLLLSIITIGIAIPYWVYWSMKYFFTKLRVDNEPVVFTGNFGEYFGYSILLMLLSIITLGLALPYWIYWSYKYFFTKLEVKEQRENSNTISKSVYNRTHLAKVIGYDYVNISEEDLGNMEHLGVLEYEDGISAEEFRIPFKPLIKGVFGLLKIKQSKKLINHIFMHRFLHQVNGNELKNIHDSLCDIYQAQSKIPDHIIETINSYKNEEDTIDEFNYEVQFNVNHKIKTLPYLVFRANNESGVSITIVANIV